ncbi:hypothetical protein [Varibaculum cambriense]|uniref:helix-turn-helix domain-containing protein n=1 Tax=Varibaculum cambriense TaxID=184870 RepID=UPI0028FF7B03|nr:hypothetical protein [Varibaculum cambriense]MDU1224025.1 hypothetical protein [Varibaculum cambriense]
MQQELWQALENVRSTDLAGVNKGTLSRIKNRKTDPRLSTVQALLSTLRLELSARPVNPWEWIDTLCDLIDGVKSKNERIQNKLDQLGDFDAALELVARHSSFSARGHAWVRLDASDPDMARGLIDASGVDWLISGDWGVQKDLEDTAKNATTVFYVSDLDKAARTGSQSENGVKALLVKMPPAMWERRVIELRFSRQFAPMGACLTDSYLLADAIKGE